MEVLGGKVYLIWVELKFMAVEGATFPWDFDRALKDYMKIVS